MFCLIHLQGFIFDLSMFFTPRALHALPHLMVSSATPSWHLHYPSFTCEETEAHRGIYLAQGHTACEQQGQNSHPGPCEPRCWVLPSATLPCPALRGLGPASRLPEPSHTHTHTHTHTGAHVLKANCVKSDSSLALAPHVQPSLSLVRSAA